MYSWCTSFSTLAPKFSISYQFALNSYNLFWSLQIQESPKDTSLVSLYYLQHLQLENIQTNLQN